jgi:hypothetical protein
MLRRSLWLCLGLSFLAAVFSWIQSRSPSKPGVVLIVLSVFFIAPADYRATGFARNAQWILPLGQRRTAIFLWLWRVPMVPFLACLLSLPFYLGRDGDFLPGYLDYAQPWLWAGGAFALSGILRWMGRLVGPVLLGLVLADSLLSSFTSVLAPPASFSAAFASGEYDLALNLLSTGIIAVSFWTLRFHLRQKPLLHLPRTPQAAARYLELHGGAWARILSALSSGIRVDRLSGHWLPQLLARCFLRTSSVFMLATFVLIHYGFALAPRTYAPRDYWFLFFMILSWLTPADPRTLRRLPLSASMIAALTVFLTLFAAAFFTLPTFAFQRVPGSLGVQFFLPHLFSLQALGSVVAYAGLLMLCWMLWIYFPRLSGVSFMWVYALWGLPLLVVGTVMHALHSGFESEQDGWRSDLIVGGFLLLGGATLYAILLRRGHRLYTPTAKGGSRPLFV